MHRSRTKFAAVLIALGAVPPAFAQPVINEKALPKGITAAQASASLEAAKKKMQSMDDSLAATLKKSSAAAANYLSPMSKKAEELAKSDKAYRAFLDKQKSIASSTKSDMIALVREHYAKNKDLLDRVYRLSGGDAAKDGPSIAKAFINYNPALQRVIESVLAFASRRIEDSLPPPGSPLTLTPPYAVQDTGTTRSGIGFTDPTATVTTGCTFDLHAFAMEGVGTCNAMGFAMVYVDMPPDKSTMDISVAYNAHYKVTAAGSIYSFGHAATRLLVTVLDTANNTVVYSNITTVDEVMAYMWFAEKDLPLVTSFNNRAVVTPGKRYAITFRPSAFAGAANAAWGESNLTITPASFNISFR